MAAVAAELRNCKSLIRVFPNEWFAKANVFSYWKDLHWRTKKRLFVKSADTLGMTSIQALFSDQIKFCVIVL